jgi:hypothetical protein
LYESAAAHLPQIYRISAPGFGLQEWLLIENRQAISYDTEMPAGAGGLAIYHIDEASDDTQSTGPTSSNWPAHYRVALLQVWHPQFVF